MSGNITTGRLIVQDFKTGCDLARSDGVAIAIELSHHDAVRIAACWNAFDGIETLAINGANVRNDWDFIRQQRDQLERAEANLRYFRNALYCPGIPSFKVDGGDAMPTITSVRVEEILQQRDAAHVEIIAARALLREAADVYDIAEGSRISKGPRELTERIRKYLSRNEVAP